MDLLAQLSNSAQAFPPLLLRVSKQLRIISKKPENTSNIIKPPPQQVQNRLSGQDVDRLVEAYLTGASVQVLAVEFKIDRHTVSAHLERHGIARRVQEQKLTDRQLPEVIDLYASGWSLVRVGDHFGVNAETVRRALLSAGAVLRPKGRRRKAPNLRA